VLAYLFAWRFVSLCSFSAQVQFWYSQFKIFLTLYVYLVKYGCRLFTKYNILRRMLNFSLKMIISLPGSTVWKLSCIRFAMFDILKEDFIFCKIMNKGSPILPYLWGRCMYLTLPLNCATEWYWMPFFKLMGWAFGYCGHYWPIVPAEIGGMKIGRGNLRTRRKPAPAPLRPPQILHD
jgi:hypothetical protein